MWESRDFFRFRSTKTTTTTPTTTTRRVTRSSVAINFIDNVQCAQYTRCLQPHQTLILSHLVVHLEPGERALTFAFRSFSETTNFSKKWGPCAGTHKTICYNLLSRRLVGVPCVYIFMLLLRLELSLRVGHRSNHYLQNSKSTAAITHSITAFTEYHIRSLNHVLHSDTILSVIFNAKPLFVFILPR